MVTLLVIILICTIPVAYLLGGSKKSAINNKRLGMLQAEKRQIEVFLCETRDEWSKSMRRSQSLETELKKVKSQKKSSEVRTGLIAEQMAPFLDGFPYDHRRATLLFLGRPIDFLAIDAEGVHFVEVKSGNSQLNANQRRVRDLINDKKVTFEVYRIKGE